MPHPSLNPEAFLGALIAAWFLVAVFTGIAYAFANDLAMHVGTLIIAGSTIIGLLVEVVWSFLDTPPDKFELPLPTPLRHKHHALLRNHSQGQTV